MEEVSGGTLDVVQLRLVVSELIDQLSVIDAELDELVLFLDNLVTLLQMDLKVGE